MEVSEPTIIQLIVPGVGVASVGDECSPFVRGVDVLDVGEALEDADGMAVVVDGVEEECEGEDEVVGLDEPLLGQLSA